MLRLLLLFWMIEDNCITQLLSDEWLQVFNLFCESCFFHPHKSQTFLALQQVLFQDCQWSGLVIYLLLEPYIIRYLHHLHVFLGLKKLKKNEFSKKVHWFLSTIKRYVLEKSKLVPIYNKTHTHTHTHIICIYIFYFLSQ